MLTGCLIRRRRAGKVKGKRQKVKGKRQKVKGKKLQDSCYIEYFELSIFFSLLIKFGLFF
jgi:hypothetical protein